MELFSVFRKPKPIVDSILGVITFSDGCWKSSCEIDGKCVEVALDGSKHQLNEFARAQFVCLLPSMDNLWGSAKKYIIQELVKHEAPFKASLSDLVLTCVSIHKEKSFDDGHLAFWFDLNCDDDGTYYVSFLEGKPNYLHRDS
ncbi:hypothetical protein [Candidatus Colwellia aromaticivorans]|uniref:hypothetical protein n=1 Tax=Candidatus Colwellia aromaticivorans TaxID=2267621 RepID=UPI000DF20279|nr:hypothetical protein [Candidatus Colwellia aromaticivorans]